MNPRLALAGLFFVAGIAVLAGVGWALLACSLVLLLLGVPQSLVERVGDVIRWVIAARAQAAVVVMPFAVLAVGVGALLTFGVGVALISVGVITGGLSILLGWDVPEIGG